MEMGSVQLNPNGNCIDGTSVENSISPDPIGGYSVFGDPEILPRVGDQYQVEIPALITKSEYVLYKNNPLEVEFSSGVPSDFLRGLPIPLMWINKDVKLAKRKGLKHLDPSNGKYRKNGVSKSETNKEAPLYLLDDDSKLKVEAVDIALGNLDLEQKMNSKTRQKYTCSLVPGSVSGPWSDIEEASFLLGLYIFEKNLIQVKKFMGSKSMGDIQSFYYGKFYRSDKYRRWSDCRKMRSRKCVYGQRIFTGLRQQELLSRLVLHDWEECQSTLLEVSKTFGEGKMPLEEYVSTLRGIVGLNSLVEAVGIGKGKRDLTGMTIEPFKSNHAVSTRSEIPIGKACSSLTPSEIIKFLTGDFRLSKARSNDLFWEAVWPRLLARGWHSEQPKDYNYAACYKHSLVFLVPGVKKFSRRRLVKGNHFFDSVADVLRKVASDPCLLELETEADDRNGNKEEDTWEKETKTDQRHCYLQPRTPNHVMMDVMKFTVVDTSMGDGKIFKVRELKTLPNEALKTTLSRSHSDERDDGSSEPDVSSENLERVDAVLFDQEGTCNSNSRNGTFSCEKKIEFSVSNHGSKRLDSGDASVAAKRDFNSISDHKKPRKSKKRSWGTKHNNLNYVAPITGRFDTTIFQQHDTNKSNSTKVLSDIGMFSLQSNLEIGSANEGTRGLDLGDASLKNSKEFNRFYKIKRPKNTEKWGWEMKEDDPTTVTKRRKRLNACKRAESIHKIPSFSVDRDLGQEKHIFSSETTDSSENNFSRIFSTKNASSSGSSRGGHIESSEGISCATYNFVPDVSCDNKPRSRPLIDLNFPQVSPDFENAEENETSSLDLDSSNAPNPLADVAFSEQRPSLHSRRQSTRNRPLTVRALEALANGFLTTSTRRKNKEAFPGENSRSRTPRQAQGGMEATEDFSYGTTESSQKGEVRNTERNVDVEILGEHQVLFERNEAGKQTDVVGELFLDLNCVYE